MGIERERLDNIEMTTFLRRYGKSEQGQKLLSVLGELNQFHNALETPIGKQLLGNIDRLMREKAEVIETEKADDRDWGEFRAYRRLGIDFARRIMKFYNLESEVKEIINAEPKGRN